MNNSWREWGNFQVAEKGKALELEAGVLPASKALGDEVPGPFSEAALAYCKESVRSGS